MALTNAERQERYRQRLKRRASLDVLGEQAREACERALLVLWGQMQEDGDAETHGLATLADYRATYANPKADSLADDCRAYLKFPDDFSEEELTALRVVVELDDALRLRDS